LESSNRSRILYYFPDSATTSLIRDLPNIYERLPLDSEALAAPYALSMGVVLIAQSDWELSAALECKAKSRYLEVVLLVNPAKESTVPVGEIYAVLPENISPVFLAKTLDNAYAHLHLLEERDRTQGDLARLANELRDLNLIGIRLSGEQNTEVLLELILSKAREITQSDAGTLYLVEEGEDGSRMLRFALAQNDSFDIPFRQFTLPISDESLAGYVALTGEIENIADAYTLPPTSRFQINQAFDRQAGYHSKSMLAVPMKTPQNEMIGVFQLINCKPDPKRRFITASQIEENVIPYSRLHQDLAASLASQAAVALQNRRLYESIQALFEGFVKASVIAIESRDPTTAGHSFRVADLTVGLAEAVNRAESRPYCDIHFSRQEIKEIRYASILHDFGKVGVREQVLVKAKKLYPGHIELIRQRAELIKQGIELKYSQRKTEYLLERGRERFEEHLAREEAEVAALLCEIDEYVQTILAANEPTVMPEDTSSVLHRIAFRSFEDHRGNRRTVITPEEAAYLSIPMGSLTAEERTHFESHVIHTYNFLSQIPWTKDLKRIPEIAWSHHERLNGRGYPRKLSAAQIPIQTELIMISDIFDALTAMDRPYKKAVPLERALNILQDEKRAGALNPALVDLFIDEKVYQRVMAP